MEPPSLVLDGNHGEGGGQILRTALFLSLLTGTSFRIERIRQNRRVSGLKPQHQGIIRLLAEMTGSQAEGVHVGAAEVTFRPGRVREGAYRYDIGTAGSIPLFLQTIIPVMLATPGRTELVLIGGTDVTFGPTIEWVRRAYLPLLTPLAATLRVDVQRRGFYPKGGGEVRVVVESLIPEAGREAMRSLVRHALGGHRTGLEEPITLQLASIAHQNLAARRVAERQAAAALEVLNEAGLVAEETIHYADAYSMGSSLTLVGVDAAGNRIGADGLGAQGVTAEAVGQRVAQKWLRDQATGAPCDEHLADHMVPWIALGGGSLRAPRVTGHLETNVWVCNQFLGDAVRLEGSTIVGQKNNN